MQTEARFTSSPLYLERGKLPLSNPLLQLGIEKKTSTSEKASPQTEQVNPFAGKHFGQNTADRFESASLRTAQCDALALSLMLPYKNNPAGLLGHLQGMGVQILNGRELPWVDQYLASNGADAAFRLPNLSSAGVGASGALSTASLTSSAPNALAPQSPFFQDNRFSLLISSNPLQPATLFHETLHALKAITHTGAAEATPTADPKSHSEAYQAWQRFSQKMNNPFFQVKLFFFTLPALQRQLNQNEGRSPWPASPTGNAIRAWMGEEQDVCRFMTTHGNQLGLTAGDITENKGRGKLYNAFHMLSYQFDQKAFEASQSPKASHLATLPQYAGANPSSFTPVVLEEKPRVLPFFKPAAQALIPALK